MTKDDFFELIQEHKDYGGYVHQDTLAERLAELFAAGANEGQASKYHDQEPDWENPAPMYFKEQTERTSPAPSVADAAGASENDVARVIFSNLFPRGMCPSDWDSGAILGPNNETREQFLQAARAVIAAIAKGSGK